MLGLGGNESGSLAGEEHEDSWRKELDSTLTAEQKTKDTGLSLCGGCLQRLLNTVMKFSKEESPDEARKSLWPKRPTSRRMVRKAELGHWENNEEVREARPMGKEAPSKPAGE